MTWRGKHHWRSRKISVEKGALGKQLALKRIRRRSGGSQGPTLPEGSGQKHLRQQAGELGLEPGRSEAAVLVDPRSPPGIQTS